MTNQVLKNWELCVEAIRLAVEKRKLYKGNIMDFGSAEPQTDVLKQYSFAFFGDSLVLFTGPFTRGEYVAIRDFAESHGLQFKAADGVGSKFKILLPVLTEAEDIEAAYAHHNAISRQYQPDYHEDRKEWDKCRQYFGSRQPPSPEA